MNENIKTIDDPIYQIEYPFYLVIYSANHQETLSTMLDILGHVDWLSVKSHDWRSMIECRFRTIEEYQLIKLLLESLGYDTADKPKTLSNDGIHPTLNLVSIQNTGRVLRSSNHKPIIIATSS